MATVKIFQPKGHRKIFTFKNQAGTRPTSNRQNFSAAKNRLAPSPKATVNFFQLQGTGWHPAQRQPSKFLSCKKQAGTQPEGNRQNFQLQKKILAPTVKNFQLQKKSLHPAHARVGKRREMGHPRNDVNPTVIFFPVAK